MTIAKVFKSGNSQAVRIPKEYQLDVDEVEIIKRGEELVIRKKPQNAAVLFDALCGFSEDFMSNGREQLPMQTREFFK